MLRQRPQDSCLMRIKAVAGDLSASQLAGIVTVLKHFEYPADMDAHYYQSYRKAARRGLFAVDDFLKA